MKYQNTSRVLSLLFHSLIFAIFGALGIYFGAFVVPFYFTAAPKQFCELDAAFNLFLELAVLGLTLMVISIYGIVVSVKGILAPSDDAPVVKAFTAFIVEGYIGAFFFLLNGIVLFDLASQGKNLAFVIIMALLLAILLLIATNIPMVKLFDGKDQNGLYTTFSFGFGIGFAFLGILFLLALFGSLSFTFTSVAVIRNYLLIAALVNLVIGAMLIVAGVILLKKGNVEKFSKISGYISGSAIIVIGLAFLGSGIFDVIYQSDAVHFEGVKLAYTGVAYPILSMVFGAIAVMAGIAFVAVTYKNVLGQKKPVVKK